MSYAHGSQVSSIEKVTVGIVILCCNAWGLIWEDLDCEGLELLELEDPPPTCIYLPHWRISTPLSSAWAGIDGRMAQLGCWLDHSPTTWASHILLAKFWEEGLRRGPLQSEHFKKTISKPTRLCPVSEITMNPSAPFHWWTQPWAYPYPSRGSEREKFHLSVGRVSRSHCRRAWGMRDIIASIFEDTICCDVVRE